MWPTGMPEMKKVTYANGAVRYKVIQPYNFGLGQGKYLLTLTRSRLLAEITMARAAAKYRRRTIIKTEDVE